MKIDGLTFAEAVERLADKYGVAAAARGGRRPRRPAARARPRQRLIEAQPGRPGVLRRAARRRPTRRRPGSSSPSAASTRRAAETFGIGLRARATARSCFKHLRARGFSQEEVVAGRAGARSGGSAYDRFRGPAALADPRRQRRHDRVRRPADLRRRPDRGEVPQHPRDPDLQEEPGALRHRPGPHARSARSSQAVVVEGYTDVMACHLAGVGTAVATCGTAFGDDHARVLRRFMHDHEEFRGEVIFTFDGDAAGQKAALKAFAGDQNFVSQTYVAVEPDGLDPCDLRIKKGDAAVRELVARRVPLYRFVLANVVAQVRPRPRRRPRRRAARERPAGVEHPRQVEGRRVRPRDRRRWSASTSRRPAPRYAGPRNRPRGRRPAAAAGRPAEAPRRPPRAPAARPARPALRDRARDAQARRPAPDGDRPHHRRHRRPTTSPTRPTAAVWELVAAAGGPVAGAGDPGWVDRLRDARRPTRRSPRRSARSGSSRC